MIISEFSGIAGPEPKLKQTRSSSRKTEFESPHPEARHSAMHKPRAGV
ncbi:hypothetical protein CORMATOL_02460 [Corynebacterium matruchotii ATCC 33806]|uniref:Uncharacterized protein n=1 Tax=Corynebacterium matruchotii ATCC 33806 TaxID=566549 RepID=C0E628_9CORY|nr:hypothetical protein CORMATOL_02460 [Corynebacterium matruchotii ATCC 33806]